MITTNEPQSQLIDIVLPGPPPIVFDYSQVLAPILALSIIIIYIIYIAQRSGLKYKVLIILLKNNVIASKITPQQAAYDLAEILQSAHNTNHLTTISKDMTRSQKDEWRPFLITLSEFRYSGHEVKSQDIILLLKKAASWTARVYP